MIRNGEKKPSMAALGCMCVYVHVYGMRCVFFRDVKRDEMWIVRCRRERGVQHIHV